MAIMTQAVSSEGAAAFRTVFNSRSEPPMPQPMVEDHTWTIAVVDDDVTVLRSLSRLLTVCGYDVTTFASASAFLCSLEVWQPELLLLDLRMPESDGLELQASLVERGHEIPTIFLSGHGDVATCVRALHNGAIDFLEKPCDEEALLGALGRAAETVRGRNHSRQAVRDVNDRANRLTRREREVFRWVAAGRLNKQIAAMLGTTEKTIKVHRGRVMTKMGAVSIADLVRMFDLLEGAEAPRPQIPLDF
jgi:FixJ family two-component response regulator